MPRTIDDLTIQSKQGRGGRPAKYDFDVLGDGVVTEWTLDTSAEDDSVDVTSLPTSFDSIVRSAAGERDLSCSVRKDVEEFTVNGDDGAPVVHYRGIVQVKTTALTDEQVAKRAAKRNA